MPFDDFARVLDEVKAHQPRVKTAVFTVGGEPLVREDIIECGRKITERGFYWGTVSNAMLIDGPMMKELSAAGLVSLAVDVDGIKDDHNWLRCSETSFDRVFNAISHIRKAPHLTWDVITCVNQRNINHLAELKRLLIEAGVKKWRCFTIVPMGRAKGQEELLLNNDEFCRLKGFYRRYACRRENNALVCLRGLFRRLRGLCPWAYVHLHSRPYRGVGAQRWRYFGVSEHTQSLSTGKYIQGQLLGRMAKPF